MISVPKKEKGNALSSVSLLYTTYSTTVEKLQTEEKISLTLQIRSAYFAEGKHSLRIMVPL